MKQEDNEITTWLKTLIIAIGIINDIVLQRNHQLERGNNLDFSNSALEIECLIYLYNSYDIIIIERSDPKNWIQDIGLLILSKRQNKEIHNIFTHLKNDS